MLKIKLPSRHMALIDDEDTDLCEYVWRANKSRDGIIYVQRDTRDASGKRKTSTIHRVIAARMIGRELIKGEVVDHINGNGLDNRRSNLRICTHAENCRNRRKIKGKTLYKGVRNNRGSKINPYVSTISVGKHQVYLGTFATPEDAYIAYCRAAIQYHGKFAHFDRRLYARLVKEKQCVQDTLPL